MTAKAPEKSAPDDVGGWENDGGAQAPSFGDQLPEGITSRTITEYLVGPYRYTDLAHAIAERDRQTSSGGTARKA